MTKRTVLLFQTCTARKFVLESNLQLLIINIDVGILSHADKSKNRNQHDNL